MQIKLRSSPPRTRERGMCTRPRCSRPSGETGSASCTSAAVCCTPRRGAGEALPEPTDQPARSLLFLGVRAGDEETGNAVCVSTSSPRAFPFPIVGTARRFAARRGLASGGPEKGYFGGIDTYDSPLGLAHALVLGHGLKSLARHGSTKLSTKLSPFPSARIL